MTCRRDEVPPAAGYDKARIVGVLLRIDAVGHLERILNLVDQPALQGLFGGGDELEPVRVLGEEGFDEDRGQLVERPGPLVRRDLVGLPGQSREIQIMAEEGVIIPPGEEVNFPSLQLRNDER